MASTIRYDFSFPPKSSALNHQNVSGNTMATSNATSHTGASLVGLARSASSSLLTSAHTINAHTENNNSHYCVNHNNNCIVRGAPNSAAAAMCQPYQSNSHSHHSHSHNLLTHSITLNALSLNAPTTPRDANCSFTFDELKNTLAFMEDSPLVSTAAAQHSSSSNSSNSSAATTNSTLLMVEPTINTNDCGASVSSLSSASSSSSANSSGSSCATCTYPNSHMTKSNSTNQIHLSSSCMCAPTGNDTLINSGSNSGSLSSLQSSSNSGIIEPLLIKKSPKGCDSHKPHPSNSSSVNSLLIPGQQASQNLLQPVQNAPAVPNLAIESAAKQYRCAAQNSEATCAWKGKLPPKQYKTPIVYSTKVFVGGLPWDITEDDLIKEFGQFGPCRVEWTNKEKYNLLANGSGDGNMGKNGGGQFRNYRSVGCLNGKQQDAIGSSKQRSSPGFAYVIYDHEYSVRSLVGNCIEDYANGRDRVEYYFKISTRRVRNKEVQIIPWILADNNFALCTPKELDPKKTVFVGNLHGTITARDLAHIMNELFGCVVYAGIDIDKLKYPIGSGRVTFSHQQNFIRAVRAAFVDIQTPKFAKRIQIDPYLEDVHCCVCFNEKGIYFCRDFQCYNYYCGPCWQKQHSFEMMGNHKPLMRKREEKV